MLSKASEFWTQLFNLASKDWSWLWPHLLLNVKTDNKWRVNSKDGWDCSVMSLTFLFIKIATKGFEAPLSPSLSQQLSELLLSALNQNLVQFTLRPGVQVTVYAAHLSAGNNPPCMCVHSQLPRTAFVPCVASGTKHRNSSQSGVFYYLTNNPNSVSDWLPPCSYTETFREWTSLQVCVPLPIGDAATVLKGLIR